MKRVLSLLLVVIAVIGIFRVPVAAQRTVPIVPIRPTTTAPTSSWRSRAIMQPYAKVYSDASLTGTEIANLKRYDRFFIRTVISDSVVYGEFHILSGHGSSVEIDEINGIYNSPDDTYGAGYISTSAFYAPSLEGTAADKQRDVVELAYSRLGLNGVYSQSKRFTDVYLDCAAMVSFCWNQVGIDFNDGGGTAVSGLVAWGLNHHAVLWQTRRTPIEENEINPIRYGFDASLFSKLEPGDLIIYYDEEKDEYPHVSLCVSGGEYYANIIETNNPSVNTISRTITAGDATASRIGMIIRPTGCVEDTTSGIAIADYSSVYWYFPREDIIQLALYADELALGANEIPINDTIQQIIDAFSGAEENAIINALSLDGEWAIIEGEPREATMEAVLSALLAYLIERYN